MTVTASPLKGHRSFTCYYFTPTLRPLRLTTKCLPKALLLLQGSQNTAPESSLTVASNVVIGARNPEVFVFIVHNSWKTGITSQTSTANSSRTFVSPPEPCFPQVSSSTQKKNFALQGDWISCQLKEGTDLAVQLRSRSLYPYNTNFIECLPSFDITDLTEAKAKSIRQGLLLTSLQ